MNEKDLHGSNFAQVHKNMLHELECDISPDSVILDFGCGAGNDVREFRKKGYRAYGCDIDNFYEDTQNSCRAEKLIGPGETIFARIDLINYRIPFPDETFDYVFSNQVFEHVQNYSQALSEIYRVLKPGGFSIHFFPSRLRPLEAHVFVPFAGIFNGYNYLAFWAFFGVRNYYQKGFDFKKVAKINHEYLTTRTTYFTKKEIEEKILNQFRNVAFAEKHFIKHGGDRLRYLQYVPFSSALIRTFHTRVVFFKKLAS
jgi:SAM-dependent methyltransferase